MNIKDYQLQHLLSSSIVATSPGLHSARGIEAGRLYDIQYCCQKRGGLEGEHETDLFVTLGYSFN